MTQPLSASCVIRTLAVQPSQYAVSKTSRKIRYRFQKQTKRIYQVLTSNDISTLLYEEIRSLSKNERSNLLKEAGITLEIPPEQGLAIMADIVLPWNKLRIIRRLV